LKKRIDQLLVEKNLAQSRERAQSLILAGKVLVNDEPVTKSGQLVPVDAGIRLREEDHPYVSRGALKLKKALETFGIQVTGKIAMDVGASTGGFTEVLLENGVEKVFAVDVGHNQLAWKIRSNPKVVVIEKLNARQLEHPLLSQTIDIFVVDVSFISLDKILPETLRLATPGTQWITLIKPQFEVGRSEVGKGGIVTDPQARQRAIENLTEFSNKIGLARRGLIESPITGTDGNIEYLALWEKS